MKSTTVVQGPTEPPTELGTAANDEELDTPCGGVGVAFPRPNISAKPLRLADVSVICVESRL